MTPRAPAMAPEQRRAAIVDAVVPLVLERGALPSTREIAEAAGIAEGTIYRVFDDKRALLHAVIERTVAPPDDEADLLDRMRRLPDLRARIELLAGRSLARHQQVVSAMMMLRRAMTSVDPDGADGVPDKAAGPPAFMKRTAESMHARIVHVFELDPDALRVTPEVAAHAFRALVFGSRHPGLPGESPLTASVIADLLVDGMGRRAEDNAHAAHPAHADLAGADA